MSEERKIGSYTVVQSCDVGDTVVLLGEDLGRLNGKYCVATVPRELPAFGADPKIIALNNEYLPMLETYASTIQKESQRMQLARRALEVPDGLIDPEDLHTIHDVNLEGRLVCLRPDSLRKVYRTQAYQVILAESGFGCASDGRGGKIYGTEVATGEEVCYNRSEVQGVFDQNDLPRWVERKMDDPRYLLDADTGKWTHLQTLRLICPLHAEISENEDGEYQEPTEVYFSLCQYEYEIQAAVDGEKLPGESKRGLMAYYKPEQGNEIEEAIARKVWDYYPKVESIGKGVNAELYGVVECHLKERLTSEEMEAFIDDVTGQLSDGWGEGFEQRPVETDEGELYVSFWSSDRSWALTEESQFLNTLAQKGVQLQ